MLGEKLKRLADVAEVSKLDLEPGSMTLAPVEGGTLAWYSGPYAAGGVVVDSTELTQMISVSALEFRDLTALFEDASDVRLKCDTSALVLSAGKRRVSLKYARKPDYELWTKLRALPSIGEAELTDLVRETGAAAAVVAVTITQPLLTGIRFIMSEKAIGLQAMNGSSLILETVIPASCPGLTKQEIVVPVNELPPTWQVMGDAKTVKFALDGRSLIVFTDTAVMKLPIMLGQWPSLAAIRALVFDETLSIPVSVIKYLAQASRTYHSDSTVVLRPVEDGKHVIIETKESELGQFQEAVPGSMARTYVLDVNDIETISKLGSGTVEMMFSETMARVQAEKRKLFVSCRVDK